MRNQLRRVNAPYYQQLGITLIELMTAVSIVSITAAITLPNLNDFVIRMEVDAELSELHRLLLTARNSAINSERNITLCPLNNDNKCQRDWRLRLVVFDDRNNNQVLDNNERLIASKAETPARRQLYYHKLSSRIVYAATGRITNFAGNGTFRYCPNNHHDKARAIRVATSGRLYLSTDLDADGKDETRDNQEIACN